jgi:uncharacterized protein YjbJ (UPF0337 family)
VISEQLVRWNAATDPVAATLAISSASGAGGKGLVMGLGDKSANAAEDAKSNVKHTIGEAAEDRSTDAEGKGDQVASNVKQTGEDANDAVKDALD